MKRFEHNDLVFQRKDINRMQTVFLGPHLDGRPGAADSWLAITAISRL